jgi:dTDP-4-amino-4,6-dideoxygalactose transaminase
MMKVPFNRPCLTGKEFDYITEAVGAGQLAGNGTFTRRCHTWLEGQLGAHRAYLTHSCTAALEMSALLIGIEPGDEIIMPSYTFVSTANAFVLRGGVPVFVDVRADTLNLDERLVERAITPRTKAIVAVHYAGVSCEMDMLLDITQRHGLLLIEDAAQGLMSRYHGRPLGAIGHLAAISFHETKNVISGEGGALIVNDARFAERAEILWEKGTDRSRFFRGEVDKYRWIDVGSSFLPGELTAAFLYAQLEQAPAITAARRGLWACYVAAVERAGLNELSTPIVPADCEHNGHMFYVMLPRGLDRARVLVALNREGVNAVSHYVPLHSAPAGQRFGRTASAMTVTDDCSERVVRLPLWAGMSATTPAEVIERLAETLT